MILVMDFCHVCFSNRKSILLWTQVSYIFTAEGVVCLSSIVLTIGRGVPFSQKRPALLGKLDGIALATAESKNGMARST
jgi:hypothetical protein